MNWSKLVIAFARISTILYSESALAQQTLMKDQLVGTWSFVSSDAKRADGSPQWGEDPKGLFILTGNGYFSWQVFRSDRPHFKSNNRLNATSQELEATNRGTLAYFGTYLVDEGSKIVTFRTEASTFPNSEGEVLKQIITKLTAEEMIYTNPSDTRGERVEAIWKRVK
jgi:hypothetical protein